MSRVSTPPSPSPTTTSNPPADPEAGATPADAAGAIPEADAIVSHDATLKWVLSDHLDLGETPEPVVELPHRLDTPAAKFIVDDKTPTVLTVPETATTELPFGQALAPTTSAPPSVVSPSARAQTDPSFELVQGEDLTPTTIADELAEPDSSPEDVILITHSSVSDVALPTVGESVSATSATGQVADLVSSAVPDGTSALGATPADFFSADPTPPAEPVTHEEVPVPAAHADLPVSASSDSGEVFDDSMELLSPLAEESASSSAEATALKETGNVVPESSGLTADANEPQGLDAHEVEPEVVMMVADSSEHVLEAPATTPQGPSTTPPPVPAEAVHPAASRTASPTEPAPPTPSPPPQIVAAALFEEFQTPTSSNRTLPEALAQRSLQKRLKPWYEEVFDEDYLRTVPFMTPDQTAREVAFLGQAVGASAGSELLDVACGYGRHAMEFAQQGCRVTGLDLSLPLLIKAADQAQKRGLSVNFVHADMREMTFNAQFDAAYCVLSSFGYFDEETNLRVASAICRALKPGGRFILEMINRDYIVRDLPSRVWWEGDGCVILEEVDFNYHTSRVLIRRSVVFGNGRQSEQEISMRAYSLHEVGRLLRQAGLRVLDVSGSLATKSRFFGAASRNIIALCERPAP
jgi:SAM-dependent methyltransferase